jgi:hypothetical protein
LTLATLLAGCNSHTKSQAGDETASINADESGKVDFNLPFVNGSVKLPEGVMHNGEFDIDGVKMIPGGKVTGVSVLAAEKGSDVDIAFSAPADDMLMGSVSGNAEGTRQVLDGHGRFGPQQKLEDPVATARRFADGHPVHRP